LPVYPAAPVILRHLLDTEPVAAVVPGMASVEEVEENVAAGEPMAEPFPILQTALCSRCGDCDDLCSQGLPVSYLFRAAYHYLYPTAPFGISTTLQYFKLHPWEEARCASCTNRTCRCESLGIDIPAELAAVQAKVRELRGAGGVCGMARVEPAGAERAFRGRPGEPFPPTVEIVGQPVGRGRPGHLRHGIAQRREPRLARRPLEIGPAILQPPHHRLREHQKALALEARQPARARVGADDAQSAQRLTLLADQRRPGIEANEGRAGDQRIVAEPRIDLGVGHLHHTVHRHRVLAEAHVARRLRRVPPFAGEELLPFGF